MIDANPEALFNKGLSCLARNEWTSALACFEKAAGLNHLPLYISFMALCIARERGQTRKAVAICLEAIEEEPDNPVIYLNLGKIYLLQGKPREAISAFRKGLSKGANDQIVEELKKVGNRRPPPLPFLKRENPINKYLGIILTRIGLRKS
jgi:tetratricopeptide (TPR) repeat protein